MTLHLTRTTSSTTATASPRSQHPAASADALPSRLPASPQPPAPRPVLPSLPRGPPPGPTARGQEAGGKGLSPRLTQQRLLGSSERPGTGPRGGLTTPQRWGQQLPHPPGVAVPLPAPQALRTSCHVHFAPLGTQVTVQAEKLRPRAKQVVWDHGARECQGARPRIGRRMQRAPQSCQPPWPSGCRGHPRRPSPGPALLVGNAELAFNYLSDAMRCRLPPPGRPPARSARPRR